MRASSDTNSSRLAVSVRELDLVRQGKSLLRGVDFEMKAGSCAALLGSNGCGKTTLSRVLTGQWFPTRGRVQVLGETLGATDVRALRRRIGLVNTASMTQGVPPVDPNLSVIKAVVTGYFGTVGLYDFPDEQQLEHARFVLGTVGLSRHAEQTFGTLSTGEQRRCLIARALVKKPELLILDEPTAGLDIAGRERVLATIEQMLAADDAPAVLMVTHHAEDLSPRTDQVLLMREGRITHAGPPGEVITPETLSATYGCKVFVRREHGRWWTQVLPEAWLDLI